MHASSVRANATHVTMNGDDDEGNYDTNSGSYFLHGPSDQTVEPSVSFTI